MSNDLCSTFLYVNDIGSIERYKVYYICLNDKRRLYVNYAHHFGFQIITGTKAWEFFCSRASENMTDLINFIRALVFAFLK